MDRVNEYREQYGDVCFVISIKASESESSAVACVGEERNINNKSLSHETDIFVFNNKKRRRFLSFFLSFLL